MDARSFPLQVLVTAATLSVASTSGRLGTARADEPGGSAETDATLASYYPAPVDGPELRLPITPTRVYVDGSFANTDDLSSLPYIQGSARNVRVAIGGTWRWRRFAFTGELPFANVTTLDVTSLMNERPSAENAHKTAFSLGDLRLGADWTEHLTDTVLGGFGLRARLATHTTGFDFALANGSSERYAFPYYFHLEPTVILGGAFGRVTVVVNQGAVVLVGPDGDFSGMHITVPTIVFWDAAYAVSYAPLEMLAASLELSTDVQLNHVGGLDFTKFNDVRSVWIAPALQFHFDAYRLDLIARFGLTQGADLFGIIEYGGTQSYTVRVTRAF